MVMRDEAPVALHSLLQPVAEFFAAHRQLQPFDHDQLLADDDATVLRDWED